MIVFKRDAIYPQIEREFAQLDKRLRAVVDFMEVTAAQLWHDDLVVTRIYEKDDSTHSNERPYRFIDFAILEAGLQATEKLRAIVNLTFPYGVKGYDTIPPLDHGTAPHMHVQVPKNASLSVWYGRGV